jgi:hypothetical protein
MKSDQRMGAASQLAAPFGPPNQTSLPYMGRARLVTWRVRGPGALRCTGAGETLDEVIEDKAVEQRDR